MTALAEPDGDVLLRAARTEPDRTLVRCRDELPRAHGAGARARLQHAMALAHAERRERPAAEARLREALRESRRAGAPADTAVLQLTAAWLRLESADPRRCFAELERAEPLLAPMDRARARCLRGTALVVTGSHRAAVAELSAAVRVLDAHADRHWLANALNARATARGYLGDPRAAERDLVRAQALFERLGEPHRAASCLHNRGFVALRGGDLPRALRFYAEAERVGLRSATFPEMLLDQAQALLGAGVTAEARAAAERACAALGMTGRTSKLAEAALAVAECAARAGDPQAARDAAARAAELFRAQRRPAWIAAARARELLARAELGDVNGDWTAQVKRVASACERYDRPLDAARLRLAAAGFAGSGAARVLLAPVAAARSARGAEQAALGCLARGRLAATPRAAAAAARAGLRRLDGAAVTAGVPSLRAELTGLGLASATASGRPRSVLAWMDRCQVALAAPEGAPREPAGGSLEVLAAAAPARQAAPDAGAGLDCAELAAALGDTAMLSFAAVSGRLHLVSVLRGRFRYHRLGSVRAVSAAVRALRLATAPGHRDPCGTAVRAAAAELDGLLLGPVAGRLGAGPCVVVPPHEVPAIPWSRLLPGQPVSVVPCVSDWLRARRGASRPGRGRVWVAGPGLPHAAEEVRGLGAGGGTVLTGGQATAPAVLAALEGAEVAHLAVHGSFRADSPLLSSVRLADGPLHGYRMAALRRPPRLLVLSACDSALLGTAPSGGVAGFASALLRRGTAAVIGSVLPVPDAEAATLAAALHANLRAGLSPAAALARAQSTHGDLGFVCLGAG